MTLEQSAGQADGEIVQEQARLGVEVAPDAFPKELAASTVNIPKQIPEVSVKGSQEGQDEIVRDAAIGGVSEHRADVALRTQTGNSERLLAPERLTPLRAEKEATISEPMASEGKVESVVPPLAPELDEIPTWLKELPIGDDSVRSVLQPGPQGVANEINAVKSGQIEPRAEGVAPPLGSDLGIESPIALKESVEPFLTTDSIPLLEPTSSPNGLRAQESVQETSTLGANAPATAPSPDDEALAADSPEAQRTSHGEALSSPSAKELTASGEESVEQAQAVPPIATVFSVGGETPATLPSVEDEIPDWLREVSERAGLTPEPRSPAQVSPKDDQSGREAPSAITEQPLEHGTSGAFERTATSEAAVSTSDLEHSGAGATESFAQEITSAQAAGGEAVATELSVIEPHAFDSSTAPAALAGEVPEIAPGPQTESLQPAQPAVVAKHAKVTASDGQSREIAAQPEPPQPIGEQGAAGEIPEWTRQLTPPPEFAPSTFGSSLRTQPPLLREDEREELPDWLRQPLENEGVPEGIPLGEELEARSSLASAMPAAARQGFKAPSGAERFEEPLEEATGTEGPLGGVRGVLPLAMAPSEPHPAAAPSPKQSDGALVFESVLSAAAAGAAGVAPIPARGARRSRSNLWIYPLILIAALVPLFIPSNVAGLGVAVSNNSPTAAFFDKIHSLAPGSTVLLAFDYDTGQTVEMNPAAQAVVQDLARRHVNIIALSTLPTGVQIAQSVLDEVSRQNPEWKSGENYVNAGYIPGGEAGLRSLSDNWLSEVQQSDQATSPLAQRVSGLRDFSLAIEFAGSGESLRAWMEQVQSRHQVPFVAAVSAAVESQARNYLAANQLAAFLRGLGGAAEYELFSNQAGLSVRTLDAQSFSHVAIFLVIVLGNLIFFIGRVGKTKPSQT